MVAAAQQERRADGCLVSLETVVGMLDDDPRDPRFRSVCREVVDAGRISDFQRMELVEKKEKIFSRLWDI
jgi:hypothetical protein